MIWGELRQMGQKVQWSNEQLFESNKKLFASTNNLGSYISVDTFFIWAAPIEIFHNLNKIIKIIIRLRPAVSWFINFFVDFLLILIDFYAEGV